MAMDLWGPVGGFAQQLGGLGGAFAPWQNPTTAANHLQEGYRSDFETFKTQHPELQGDDLIRAYSRRSSGFNPLPLAATNTRDTLDWLGSWKQKNNSFLDPLGYAGHRVISSTGWAPLDEFDNASRRTGITPTFGYYREGPKFGDPESGFSPTPPPPGPGPEPKESFNPAEPSNYFNLGGGFSGGGSFPGGNGQSPYSFLSDSFVPQLMQQRQQMQQGFGGGGAFR